MIQTACYGPAFNKTNYILKQNDSCNKDFKIQELILYNTQNQKKNNGTNTFYPLDVNKLLNNDPNVRSTISNLLANNKDEAKLIYDNKSTIQDIDNIMFNKANDLLNKIQIDLYTSIDNQLDKIITDKNTSFGKLKQTLNNNVDWINNLNGVRTNTK